MDNVKIPRRELDKNKKLPGKLKITLHKKRRPNKN